MIESLTEHLHLNDAIQDSVTQRRKHLLLFFTLLLAVNDVSRDSPAPHTAFEYHVRD